MTRLLTFGLACCMVLAAVLPVAAQQTKPAAAAQPPPDPTLFLDAVPENAWAFASIRSGRQLNDKIMRLLEQLGIAAILPIPAPLDAVRDYSGIGEGFVDAGTIGVVVLKTESMDQLTSRLAILVPSTNVKSMIANLNPAEQEGGLWSATIFDTPVIVGQKGDFAVVAATADTVKEVINDKSKITPKVTGQRLAAFKSDDIFVWIDVAGAMQLAKPFIDNMMKELEANPQTGSMAGWFQQSMKYVDDMKTLQAGLTLDAAGLKLHYYTDAKPETELAKLIADQKPSDKSLLVGLPKEKFILACGMSLGQMSREVGAKQIKSLVDWLATQVPGLNAEKMKTVAEKVETLYMLGSAYSVSISMLPEGPQGMVGLALVAQCEDSAKWMAAFEQLLDVGKALAKEQLPDEAEKIDQVLPALKKDAEKAGDVSVHHFVVNLDAIPEITADKIDPIKKVVGQEGILLRIAAADAKHIVVGFGGGPERFDGIVKLAAGGQAPLADDTGIQRSVKTLPKKRVAEVYIALDAAGQLIKAVMDVAGMGGMIPFPIPDVNAPITLIGSAGKDYQQGDLFIPMELVIAVKDVALNAMGGMMAPPPAPETKPEAKPEAKP